MSGPDIRDAATIILVRDADSNPRILMGRRGKKAAFMPSKYVFPGGAVDPDDETIAFHTPIDPTSHQRLSEDSPRGPDALAAAAIRELWEETGLILGARGAWDSPPQDWRDFAAAGYVPSAAGLSFVFRAITPPGRTRRFDARFFTADARYLANDPDNLPTDGELSELAWLPLPEVRKLDMPFVTEVVLAEIARSLPYLGPPRSVAFFANDDESNEIRRLGGRSPLSV